MKIEKKFVNGIVLASLVSSSLSACSPVKNPTNSNLEDKIPITEQYIPEQQEEKYYDEEKTVQEMPGVLASYNTLDYPVAKQEVLQDMFFEEPMEIESQFDYSVLDILNWQNFEIDTIEKQEPGYVVEVTNPTSLFAIPLTNDEFVDKKREVEEIVLTEGVNFEIGEVHNLKGPGGESISVGLLANTFGAKAVMGMILEAKDSTGIKESFVKHNESAENSVVYVTLSDNVYPNKVYNTLYSLYLWSNHQDETGGLQAGKEYSYLDLIGLLDGSHKYNYLIGLMASGTEAWGGGVCAMATGMSLLVHQNSNNKIVEKWGHPTRYFQGPFSMSPFEVDATVQMSKEGEIYDFRWIFAEEWGGKYLKIDVDLTSSGVKYSETSPRGVGGPSDVNALFSVSLTDEYPEGQSERLKEQMEDYIRFRESEHQESFDSHLHMKYDMDDVGSAVHLIYDRENLHLFKDRIENSESIQDILALKEAVNNYIEDPEVRLSEYLETTEWYRNYSNNPRRNQEDLDYAMRILSHQVRVPGQPLQCVSYVILLSILYPELDMQAVGGSGASSAKELIKKGNGGLQGSTATGYGGLLIGEKDMGIEKYKVGDHFVTLTGNHGHVGSIIDIIEDESGERYLLVTDSNRQADGKIRFFVVDARSLEYVFGYGQRYVIRSASSHAQRD